LTTRRLRGKNPQPGSLLNGNPGSNLSENQHPGLKARVSLTAYDTSQFGSLDGEVVRISPDTITDPKGETFYKAIVRTQKNALEHRGVIHRIIPGMDASVDIMVGDRTVLGYFLKPILRTTSEAFRER
jgi:adhesin transport system membrane fusion protein